MVTVGYVIHELVGGVFLFEGADLHRPAPTGIEGNGSAQDFQANQRKTGTHNVDFFRRRL